MRPESFIELERIHERRAAADFSFVKIHASIRDAFGRVLPARHDLDRPVEQLLAVEWTERIHDAGILETLLDLANNFMCRRILRNTDERLRPTEAFKHILRELREEEVDMFTTVFIGNSQSFLQDGMLITKRGYVI